MRVAVVLLCLASASALMVAAAPRALHAEEPAAEESVDDAVAKALFEQGVKLYHQKHWAEAKELFLESLARAPKGSYHSSAREMVRRCNQKLGLKVDADLPGEAPVPAPDEPENPYGDEPTPPPDGEGLENPYGDDGGGGGGGGDPDDPDSPSNPYDDGASDPATTDRAYVEPVPISPTPDDPIASGQLVDTGPSTTEARTARKTLTVFGAVYGLSLGIGLVGAAGVGEDSAALVALSVAGVGAITAYYVTKGRSISEGQSLAVMSGATWGTVEALFLAAVASDPSNSGDRDATFFAASAIGGAIGLGVGIGGAMRKPSAGDVATVNSFASYGLLGGLLLGVMMDPPDSRAYSLNAVLGSGGGLVLGALVARKTDVSRKRMAYIDLGVGLGSIGGWLLFLPIEGSENDVQIAAALSILGAIGGGYFAWWKTRGMDRKRLVERASAPRPLSLFARDGAGRWSVGLPLVHPMAPTPGVSTFGYGVDLLSGSF